MTDGIINNGTKAANGFEALREYDENKDGVIDAKDNIYNALNLWQDSNSDGITDTGELHSLSEMGVTSINLGSTSTNTYEAFNTITNTVLATLLVQQLYGKESYSVTQGQFDYTGLFVKLGSTLTAGTTTDKTLASNIKEFKNIRSAA